MLFQLSNLNSNLALTLDYLNPALNNLAMDNPVSFPNIYPLDSDLSSGWRYLTFKQPGPEGHRFDSCWDNSDFFLCTTSDTNWKNIFLVYSTGPSCSNAT